MSFFIRQRWYDHRLAYQGRFDFSKVELDTKVMSNIWVPDLYIKNEKKSEIHAVTVPNKLMHIYPDGLVVYSIRYSHQIVLTEINSICMFYSREYEKMEMISF